MPRDGFACIAPDFFHKHPDQAALNRGDVVYAMTDGEAVHGSFDAAISELGAVRAGRSIEDRRGGRLPDRTASLVLAAQRPIAAALVW